MSEFEELIGFLKLESRLDLKAVAVSHVLSLTGSVDGIKLLSDSEEILRALTLLTEDTSDAIAKDASLCLVNISAEDSGSSMLLQATNNNIVKVSLKHILNKDSALADPCSMILSNISRPARHVEQILDALSLENNDAENINNTIEKLVQCFTKTNYNSKKAKLNYIGPIFSNLTQSSRGRALLGTPDILIRLLPFTSHKDSIVRRGGAIGLLRNLCFDKTRHPTLLGQTDDDIDVLPFILLPLAGPEEYDDEDNDKFPPELQYLGPDKVREEALDLRVMLLECLGQLCATRNDRQILRDCGTYEILRELHKWETNEVKKNDGDRAALLACENVVDILIRTEEEIGEDDLTTLEVTSEMKEKFSQMDEEFLGDR